MLPFCRHFKTNQVLKWNDILSQILTENLNCAYFIFYPLIEKGGGERNKERKQKLIDESQLTNFDFMSNLNLMQIEQIWLKSGGT